jgi:hypothetical protein
MSLSEVHIAYTHATARSDKFSSWPYRVIANNIIERHSVSDYPRLSILYAPPIGFSDHRSSVRKCGDRTTSAREDICRRNIRSFSSVTEKVSLSNVRGAQLQLNSASERKRSRWGSRNRLLRYFNRYSFSRSATIAIVCRCTETGSLLQFGERFGQWRLSVEWRGRSRAADRE